MSRSRVWTKRLKAKAKWLRALTNVFLKQKIRREDLLSNPDKIRKCWKVLKKNLPKIIDHPSYEFEIKHEESVKGMVDIIGYYNFILKYICGEPGEKEEAGFEEDEEPGEFWDTHDDEPLLGFMGALKKCKTEGCGKWIVLTSSNKEHCTPKCASKDYQRRRRATNRKKYNEDIKKYRREHREKVKQYYLNSLEKKRKKEQASKEKKNG
jgi:hypothetical protein